MNTLSAACEHCFALLDDCDASEAEPRSRLYTAHVGTLVCTQPQDLEGMWAALMDALDKGRHAVGLFSYELGAQMQGIAARAPAGFPSRILLFERCERLSAAQVDAWLEQQSSGTGPAGIANLRPSVGEAGFQQAIARIHTYLEAGDTYQVNYSYRLRFDAYGSLPLLYRRLRQRQPVPYGAFIVLPEGGAVLSLSPELFIRHMGGRLQARPMKGTAAASGDAGQDAARAAALAADAKNRAENLMIVDLLRNDLGRIAVPGSVSVPRLFQVDRYDSVLQMTSTVTATLRPEASLAECFAALFPCGSITGAPKRRTMEIIRELETDARGLYTGAIGRFDAPPEGRAVGDFCLSVPIRTLVLQPSRKSVRVGEMGVGAGIVYDSVAADEWAECRLKARFLTGLPKTFELFETMHATSAGCRHLDLHLHRLHASAAYFGFAWNEEGLRQALNEACMALHAGPHRLRLALRQDGTHEIQCAPLAPLAEPSKILLAPAPTEADDPFLRHKSTVRERYDAAWRAAEARGAFDMLFHNSRGELTEGGRSNVFVKLDGRWYTPPLECGLLPGVMRAVLLADPQWGACERKLTLDDLRVAQEVVVCNALRGALRARVEW